MKNCIHCKSKLNKGGYGFTTKRKLEHRLVFMATYPEVDITKKILHHTCGNKWCINPEHLQVTTLSEHYVIHGFANNGTGGENRRKTRCLNGHRFDMFWQKGKRKQRICSICAKERSDRWYKINKEKRNKRKREKRLNNNILMIKAILLSVYV